MGCTQHIRNKGLCRLAQLWIPILVYSCGRTRAVVLTRGKSGSTDRIYIGKMRGKELRWSGLDDSGADYETRRDMLG